MKRLNILWLAAVAMLALCALVPVAASAAEWLVENKSLTTAVPAETEYEMTFILLDTTVHTTLNDFLCHFKVDMTIGPGSADLIEKWLTIGGVEITLATPLLCTVDTDAGSLSDCQTGANVALIAPANLPWETLLELMANGEELDIYEPEPAFEVECTTLLGVALEDKCSGRTSVKVSNTETSPISVLDVFNFAEPISSELGNCVTSGAGAAAYVGEGNTWALSGTTRLSTTVV